MLATVLATIATAVAAFNLLTAAAPLPTAGWTLVWSDNFNGAAHTGVNTANWQYDLGHGYPGGPANWGTGEVESMTDSTTNVRQDGNGHLLITPVKGSAGSWTSGRIETRRSDFAAPVGGKLRVEGRLQQPNVTGAAAAGYWSAFWMMGDAFRQSGTDWPSLGEIDIAEAINGRSSLFSTLHCGKAVGGPCKESTGLSSGERACAGCQTGLHTYAMEYDRSVSPEQIRWYLDGVNFFTVDSTRVDAKTWNNATHHGFFIILNVAIGGGLPAAFGGGPTGATASDIPMIVDYVAVYTSRGSSST